MALVHDYHELAGDDLPNARLHAAIHTIVENQLAMGIPEVRETLDRLLAEGLDRHDALHAIGMVLAELIFYVTQQDGDRKNVGPMPDSYYRELKELTAEKWRENF